MNVRVKPGTRLITLIKDLDVPATISSSIIRTLHGSNGAEHQTYAQTVSLERLQYDYIQDKKFILLGLGEKGSARLAEALGLVTDQASIDQD